METIPPIASSDDPNPERRLSFDQHVQGLPASRQTAHRWVVWLLAVAIVLTVGVFIYAIYASVNWRSVGEAAVVLAWLYFFLAGALAALVMGLDTLIVGATVPPPFERSKYSFTTGREAVRQGRGLIGYAAVVTLLVVVGAAAVRAGRFGLEDWVRLVVGFWVAVGLVAAARAILRGILRLS